MLLGSGASVFVSVAAFALYTSAWQIPGPEFPAPTAEIWLDMAELVRCCQQWDTYIDMYQVHLCTWRMMGFAVHVNAVATELYCT